MEPLWIRLRTQSREDIIAKEDTLHTDWAKLDVEQEKWKADMIKAYEQKWMTKQKADQEWRLKEKPMRRAWLNGKLTKKEGRPKEKPTRRS
jgi:cell division protein FtsL